MLVEMYDDLQSVAYPPIPTQDNFQEIVDWAMDLALTVSTATVAAFHLLMALAMRFGDGVVFDMAGLVSLKSIVAGTIGLVDTSYTECECADEETPDTFWYMNFDFSISTMGFEPVGSLVHYISGGWEPTAGSGVCTYSIKRGISANLETLAGIRTTSLRRGSDGNGTNDFKRLTTFPNFDVTGTETQRWNANFLTCNTNDCVSQNIGFTNAGVTFRSIRVFESVNGNVAIPSNFARITRVELWGWNNTDIKPPGSIWVPTRV
jgi:hypothetical protein